MESHLGRYTVLAHLASGGMADVLLARTDGIEGFQRHVVLKRIRPEYARDERFIRMFLHEARLVADLHHHNIVQVYDVGQEGDEYFLAMEYLHGEDLRTVLSAASKRRVHVPLGHVIAMVSAAAAGLHYAHERRGSDNRPLGIVHRDISPSNLLVGYDGSVKIVDFGIAKASAQDDTHSGSLRGKISYLSPEQCKGERVDRRSDVYALGVVLYELATTTRLFKGDSDYRVMEAIVNGRIALPKVRRPDLPDELSAIIMRALATDPERRYFTADELRVALDQLARKAGLTSSPSAIASYMRKQFGERAEPWIDGRIDGAEPVVRPSPAESSQASGSGAGASASWVEISRAGGASRSSTSSIPVQTGPLGLEGLGEAAAKISQAREPVVTPPPPAPPSAQVAATRPPQPRSTRSRGKAAMIGVPLVLLAGIAVWRLVLGDSAPPPPVVAVAPVVHPAPVAPPPAPAPAPPAVHMPAIDDLAPAAAAPRAKHDTAAAEPAHPSAKKTVARSKGDKADEPASPAPITLPTVHLTAAPAPPAPEAAPTPAPAPAVVAPPVVAPAAPAPAPAPAVVPAAPAAPAAAPSVASNALDANRISGDKNIAPDDATQTEMRRRGADKAMGVFKVCLAASGDIGSVAMVKSTGFTDYDWKIQTTIRNKWRYKPFLVNGQASAVCTAVRFVYSQH